MRNKWIFVLCIMFLVGCSCNRWSPDNHCDALCYYEYDTRVVEEVVPLDDNYNEYVCVCDKGNVTTRWACI